MRQALDQLGAGDDGHELPRRHPDRAGDQGDQHVAQEVVEQVVAVVTPHRHVALAVVHGVQRPPAIKAVLPAMDPVIQQVEHQQVDHKRGPGRVGDAGPPGRHPGVELDPVKAMDRCGAEQRVQPRPHQEEHPQPEQAQPVDERVDDVHPRMVPCRAAIDRPPPLQWREHRQHDGQLHQPDQQPARCVVGVLQQIALAHCKQHGLHQGLEQGQLDLAKSITQRGQQHLVDHGVSFTCMRAQRISRARRRHVPDPDDPGA